MYEKAIDMINDVATWLYQTEEAALISGRPEAILPHACAEGSRRLLAVADYMAGGAVRKSQEELKRPERTVYTMLKGAAHIADVIEAAETGYVSLSNDDILKLDVMLLSMVDEIQRTQHEKISGAATPEIDETH